MANGLLTILFDLAYKSRYTIPLLISAGFMVLDGYQITIELEVEGNVRHQDGHQPGNNNNHHQIV